jgi:UDP-glucuronate 4-epimerase
MALFLFTKAILAGEPIKVFNHGKPKRSFTFVDDMVESVIRTLDHTAGSNPAWDGAAPDPASSNISYRNFNICNEQPVERLRYIEAVELCLGRKAKTEMLPLQACDVSDTEADVSELIASVGYSPSVQVEEGARCFVAWCREYYGVE